MGGFWAEITINLIRFELTQTSQRQLRQQQWIEESLMMWILVSTEHPTKKGRMPVSSSERKQPRGPWTTPWPAGQQQEISSWKEKRREDFADKWQVGWFMEWNDWSSRRRTVDDEEEKHQKFWRRGGWLFCGFDGAAWLTDARRTTFLIALHVECWSSNFLSFGHWAVREALTGGWAGSLSLSLSLSRERACI